MKRFGLLGGKLRHSFSPQIHALLGDYDYQLYEVNLEGLDGFMRGRDWEGLNVTIPYKEAVIAYCRVLSPRARVIGSVNTVIRKSDGSLWGDNTDYDGFCYLLDQNGLDAAGKKALILGSGGAAKTVRAVLGDRRAAAVIVVSRSGENHYGNLARHDDADLIVNTTPVGMYPHVGEAPIDLSLFVNKPTVIDLIYNPARTELLFQAEALGFAHCGGLAMLVAQAKKASELFQGKRIADAEIQKITEIISRKMKNIILIGMPGSGKTIIGKELAILTGRRFYDTDELITEEAGKSIPEIFNEDGEEVFRELETKVLARITKGSGSVIATGGGVVTQDRNRKLIRQNGIAVFLDRDIDLLPKEGRPLSQIRPIEDIYMERLPLYRAWSEFTFASLDIEETVQKIKEELRL